MQLQEKEGSCPLDEHIRNQGELMNLYDIPELESRSVNAENPTGERSQGGTTGGGRKGAPCLKHIAPGETVTLMNIEGPGCIRHIWMTFPPELRILLRAMVLRMYWDDQESPSVEVPVGDFFGIAHARQRDMENELTAFQGGKGLNCWIPMPFKKSARVTLENDSDIELPMLFYQIDLTLGDALSDSTGYFHAQFRRVNCQPIHTDYVILDGIRGKGRYLGTVLGVREGCREVNGWWGEGEVKMFFDGEETPTICGTGAEDYIGFAWGLGEGCSRYQGCPLADYDEKLYSLYRFHVKDPIVFKESLRVTIQQIGCGLESDAKPVLKDDFVRYPAAGVPADGDLCYYDRTDDYSSVAYWYQTLPTMPFPVLPGREERVKDLGILRKAEKEEALAEGAVESIDTEGKAEKTVTQEPALKETDPIL